MTKKIKITLWLLSTILWVNCYAEQQSLDRYFNKKKKCDSIIVIDESIGTMRQTFKYNELDLLVEETYCDLDDDGTVAFGTIIKYEYNKHNQIIQSITYEYNSHERLGLEQYIYDKKNNLSKIVNGKVILSEYQYDDDNNLIEAIEGANMTTYLYYNGQVIEKNIFALRGQEWVEFEKNEYVYVGEELLEETGYVWLDDDWHEKYRYIYYYNEKGRMTERDHEIWNIQKHETIEEDLTYKYKDTENGLEIIEYANGELSIRTIYFFHKQE